jgi:cytochrome c-type biogenesis protein CcmH
MIKKVAAALLLVTGLWLAIATSGLAQTPTPDKINEVAESLWCPLCNGVRLDNCDLQACIQMKEVIAEKLAAGESQEQIRTYFVQQYGDVVMGAPSTQGFSRLAWILPVLAGAVGLAWLIYFVRSVTRKRPAATSAVAQPTPSAQKVQDEYIQRVDEEMRRYQ